MLNVKLDVAMQSLNLPKKDVKDVFQRRMTINVISINQKIKYYEQAINGMVS